MKTNEKNEYHFGVWKVNTEARKNIAGRIFFLRINGNINFADNLNANKRTIQTNNPKISILKINNQFNKKFNIDPPAINEKILDQFPDIPGCNIYISIEKRGVEFEFNIEEPESIKIEQIIIPAIFIKFFISIHSSEVIFINLIINFLRF